MSLLLLLLLPFAGSLCAAALPTNARNAEAWLSGLVALACAGITLSLYPMIAAGETVRFTLPWIPSLGLNLSLRMDGFAWLFSLLVSAMGALVVLYARYYMSPEDPVARFFAFFLTFMGAMLGVLLSGNLIQIALFWEVTSFASFMLIAYWNHRVDARRGARMALTVTGAGGLCLLAGMIMLGQIVGSYELDVVLAAGDVVRAHPWYVPTLVLVALAALTKSAQFPFQFWLPNAMAAPTPVSAYLHSATMVKLGVFLLARFWPVLSGSDAWMYIIAGAGVCSLVIGAYAAIFQQDMKGVLAYSTISHLGLIAVLLGMNSTLGVVAALFHMINHATFKASLFMAAGIVDHETGTRDLGRLSGLRHSMPITATLAIVAAASMAGVPLLNGFISKEMFFTETVYVSGNAIVRVGLPLAAVIGSTFSVAYSLRFILQVFFGRPATDLPRAPHEPPRWMLLPSALLVLACLVVGVLPALTVGPILDQAAAAVLNGNPPAYSLALWHGFNTPLIMSVLALLGGIGLYMALRQRQRDQPGKAPFIYRFDGKRSFEFLLNLATVGATRLLRVVSSPRLQVQLLLVVLGACFLAGMAWWGSDMSGPRRDTTPLDPVFMLMWAIGGACAIGAANQAKYHRLAALMMAGGAGLVTCMTFVWLSAPDLALTQLAVEVVTVVLILLGLRWLPRRIAQEDEREPLRARVRRLRDFAIAVAAGGGLAAACYVMLTSPTVPGVGPFFLENALPLGGGTNVVNVILVDFRGFDTFGEITVLGIVALTVYALLRRFRPPPESIERPTQQRDQDDHGDAAPTAPDVEAMLPVNGMRIQAVLVRLLLPVAALVSLFFLMRGHNQPGGGFVGGLVMATAIILQYMVGGTVWVENRTRIHPQYWIALGLLCAVGAGLLAWSAGLPFLTAMAAHPVLPWVGELHLSTVLIFDLGVYLLVIGATVLMLVALAHQSLRSQRRPVAAPAPAGGAVARPVVQAHRVGPDHPQDPAQQEGA